MKFLFIGGCLHGQIKDVPRQSITTVMKPNSINAKDWTEISDESIFLPPVKYETYDLITYNTFGLCREAYVLAGLDPSEREVYMGKLLTALFDAYLEINCD